MSASVVGDSKILNLAWIKAKKRAGESYNRKRKSAFYGTAMKIFRNLVKSDPVFSAEYERVHGRNITGEEIIKEPLVNRRTRADAVFPVQLESVSRFVGRNRFNDIK